MQLEVGAIVEGKVTGFMNFGAFVELGEGKKGMVHISEVATEYVENIKDHLQIGQIVKVKIIGISEDGKISLSIRKAIDNPRPQHRPRGNNNAPRRGQQNSHQDNRNSEPQAQSFESMMAKFKQQSEDRMSDLKRDSKHGGGYNRRGTNKL